MKSLVATDPPETGPVHARTRGIDGDFAAFRQFFERGFDYPELVRRSRAALDQFHGVDETDHAELQAQMRIRYKGHFPRFTGRKLSFAGMRASFRTIAGLPAARRVSLAAALIIGLRESGIGLLRSRDLRDSFWQSGLDHFFALQGTLRRQGLLPKKLSFAKGVCFGDVNADKKRCRRKYGPDITPHLVDPTLCTSHVSVKVDKKCRIESAYIPAKHVFLAHWARVGRAGFRFEEIARARGFDDHELANVPDMTRFFLTSFAFGRPGGFDWSTYRTELELWRKGKRKNRPSFGSITLISRLKDEGLDVEDAVRAPELFLPRKPGSRVRRGPLMIAVRTAAVIYGLDSMLRDYLNKAGIVMEINSEFELIRAYLSR